MENAAFLLRIDPKKYEEYRRRHEQVDSELEQQFLESGIYNYQIFYHEGTLFAFMMVENFDEAMQKIANHPANVRWQHFMADLLIPWEDGNTIKIIRNVYQFPR